MKIAHLSDLHIGKRLNEHSLKDDQVHIFAEIIRLLKEAQPDCVIIAGDIYDKSNPSAEAFDMFDDFLVELSSLKRPIFIISGNHDSPERLSFGNRLMRDDIHIASAFDGSAERYTLTDEYGEVDFYLLPFIKPQNVRQFYPDTEIVTHSDAVRTVFESMNIDTGRRNVLIAHQFVTEAEFSGSEEMSVGGAENIDSGVFSDFDYVALGHIHGAQTIGGKIRYCGTPIKYSASEYEHEKSITIAELGEKGNLHIDTIPLRPLHDLTCIRGTYDELMERSFYEGTSLTTDYVYITLTDEDVIPDAVRKLRLVYQNLMELRYDNTRTRTISHIDAAQDAERKTPLQLLDELYEKQNGRPLTDGERAYVQSIIEKVWEDEA